MERAPLAWLYGDALTVDDRDWLDRQWDLAGGRDVGLGPSITDESVVDRRWFPLMAVAAVALVAAALVLVKWWMR